LGYNRGMDTRKGGARPKYPWEKWMDGTEWTIWKGTDFAIKRSSMRTMLHQKAIDTDFWCSTRFRDPDDGRQGITFRYIHRTGPNLADPSDRTWDRPDTRDYISDEAIENLRRPVES
jgi:hypothetical protein